MTLRHFHIFSTVCKKESITKAAEELNMAQPAVSFAIRELESYYGTKLFERMNRRLYITDAGKQLLVYADSVLAQCNEAKDVLSDINAMTQIRLGANVSVGNSWLQNCIDGFEKIHPEIPIYTSVQNSSQLEKQLLYNNLDFAFMDEPKEEKHFICKLICKDEMALACASEYPLSSVIKLDDLYQVPLLIRETGSGSRKPLEQIMNYHANYHPNIVMESISTMSLIEACKSGRGVLILPKSVLLPFFANNILKEVHINDQTFERNYFLVYHKSKFLTRSMQSFREYIDTEYSCSFQ